MKDTPAGLLYIQSSFPTYYPFRFIDNLRRAGSLPALHFYPRRPPEGGEAAEKATAGRGRVSRLEETRPCPAEEL